MAESTLSLTYDAIRQSVADFLGFGRTIGDWDTEQTAQVEECVQSGLRQFYSPPPAEKGAPAHAWSFLQPVDVLNLVAGKAIYTLPDHFGGLLGDPTYPIAKGGKTNRLGVITEAQIRAAIGSNQTQGPPQYAATRVVYGDGKVPTRWLLLVYPIPDAAYVLTYQYGLTPFAISETSPYPHGGQPHAETILASCLAVAEERFDDGATQHHRQRFLMLLQQSILLDQRSMQTTTSSPWPVVPASPLGFGVHYRDLLSEVGKFLEFGWDPATWSHEQFHFADLTVQQGVHQFYYPSPVPPQQVGYEWTFLRPEAVLQTNSGQSDYLLPPEFAHLEGDLEFSCPQVGYHAVKVLGLSNIRSYQSRGTACGIPRAAAVAEASPTLDGKTDGRQKLVIWPTPDGTYTLRYTFKAVPPRLSDDNPYPLGGIEHAETIRASVLAAAELRHIQIKPPMPIGRGRRVWIPKPQTDQFAQRLAASMALDQRRRPGNLGYNGDGRARGLGPSWHEEGYVEYLGVVGPYN